jgi:ferredoxin--NADP+ reductase
MRRAAAYALRAMPPSPESLEVLSQTRMGTDAYWLRLRRPSWTWKAGQLLSLTGPTPVDLRDYTIASGEGDEDLEIVYRLIPHGRVTPFLAALRAGDHVLAMGPHGRFTVRDPSRPLVFCATGTGIAPFRAFYRSHAGMKLTLLHGVRVAADLYFRGEFQGIEHHAFLSREPRPGGAARLTERLPDLPLPAGAHYYLCGANEMIYEAEDILRQRGILPEHIFHEPYYYRADD